MTLIRDPRPGISWRLTRLRRRTRKRVRELRKRLPGRLGGAPRLSKKNRFRVSWGGYWYDRPIDERLVVYESFHGNGALCNPRAIFDELLRAGDMAHLRHVWCFANLDVKREFDKQFARHPRVRSVLAETVDYYKALCTAKYLVNNQTFPYNFAKRDGQVYLNTWHGTPLKAMGYEIREGVFGVRNVVRNLLSADYLLSANEHMTQVVYARGYRLRGIYRGTIIEEGYPRIDAQFLDESRKKRVHAELTASGLDIAGEKVVLFAPTWRGTQFTNPVYDADALRADVDALEKALGPGYTVLLKVHQQIFAPVSRHKALRSRLVPNSMPTNRLLGYVDVLVTDYSSIFFDFLATGRPVLFYVPDAESYERYRGVLLDLSELPGPLYTDLGDVADGIRAIGTGTADDPRETHGQRYREAVEEYCPREDGNATARVIDIVFRGRTEGHRLLAGLPDGRTSILISMGRSKTSGVNTAMLSLLRNLDATRYDVTLLLQLPKDARERELQALVPASVRTLVRIGTFPVTAKRLETHDRFLATGLEPGGTYPGDEERVLAAEWRHSLGLSKFDHAIDFSGYAPFWPAVVLQGEAGTRSIWLHNDMLADLRRGANDERFLHKGLPAALTLYPHFDNLVSVSPALSRINAESLGELVPAGKFRSANNTVDAERIKSLARGSDVAGAAETSDIRVADATLPSAAERFVRSFPLDAVGDEIERQILLARLLPDRREATTFVTVGRLSPEKNHARMIRAFAGAHAERPDTRLLVLGDGPLMPDLEALVDRLGLGSAVTLAGYQPNPYVLMAASDCFVLSSDYEGQPMVLLEALTLGLPVVTVQFGSAESALPSGGGLVVPQTDDGLASGMGSFLRGEVGVGEFDAAQYNAAAIGEFEAAIGAAPAQQSEPPRVQSPLESAGQP
jgi:CDP-glycerol glycerophosphotransferase (TagB/SpsB family)/glycosyltransferase involved in cell wall biosynthesis